MSVLALVQDNIEQAHLLKDRPNQLTNEISDQEISPEAHLIRSAEVGLEARLIRSPFLNQPPIFTPLPGKKL